jgi:hypothetical protein
MNSSNEAKRSLRIFVGVAVPLSMIALAAVSLWLGRTPPCWFYTLTGLYCPGCGSGRCFYALLHGEIYAAFRFHPLLFIILPFLAYYLLRAYLNFVFARKLLPFPEIKSSIPGYVAIAIIVLYGVLRNVPVYPFTLLAPTPV